ncbi:hypothetical protein C8J56DRAFT_1091471 [Mycena floridula]|nr:hypothetical protein C8J56DRAFT_1091471 [Mycena floridula]
MVIPADGAPALHVSGGAELDDHLSKVQLLVRAYQVQGHHVAELDPLGILNADLADIQPPELELSRYGFTEHDLDKDVSLGSGGAIGIQYVHIPDKEQCDWIHGRVEIPKPWNYTVEEKRVILDRLIWSESFEKFIALKYPNKKRFGLEVDHRVKHVTMGMPHRGGLNVLANIIRKPIEVILNEYPFFFMHAPKSFLNAAVNVDQLRPPDRQSESSPPRPHQPSVTGPASIWAPQPQSSEMSLSGWPRTLNSFCKVTEKELSRQTMTDNVFGPAPAAPCVTMDIGAFGDGQKTNNGEYNNTHVEQLLHTLNLNSPDPYIPAKKPFLNLSFKSTSTSTGGSGSPDCSPASILSALLTPTDLSLTGSFHLKQQLPYEYSSSAHNLTEYLSQTSLLFESGRPIHESYGPHSHSLSHSPPYVAQVSSVLLYLLALNSNGYQLPSYKPISEHNSPLDYNFPLPPSSQQSINVHHQRPGPAPMLSASSLDWLIPQSQGPQQQQHQMHAPQLRVPLELQQDNQPQRLPTPAEWLQSEGYALGPQPAVHVYSNGAVAPEDNHGPVNQRSSSTFPTFHQQQSSSPQAHSGNNEPINFLSLLYPSSSPPYHTFVSCIIKSSDQQVSIFLQQKLKVADLGERTKIVDAICAHGFDMMAHRFGNWAVRHCLEAAAMPEERRKIVSCMRGRIVELATNCYGCHVLQKALDCEEGIQLLIVSELLHGDPAQTLVNKHLVMSGARRHGHNETDQPMFTQPRMYKAIEKQPTPLTQYTKFLVGRDTFTKDHIEEHKKCDPGSGVCLRKQQQQRKIMSLLQKNIILVLFLVPWRPQSRRRIK